MKSQIIEKIAGQPAFYLSDIGFSRKNMEAQLLKADAGSKLVGIILLQEEEIGI